MTDWSLYWPDWLTQRALDAPFHTLYGGWNQGTRPLKHVRPGEVVFLVTAGKGRVHLLGGFRATGVDEDTAGSPHACASLAVRGAQLGAIRLTRSVPTRWIPDWRFVNADGKLRGIRHDEGRIKSTMPMQGCFRVHADTATRLMRLLEGSPDLLSDDPELRAIEAARVERPEDRELAGVHRDALIDRGDPRAEVIAGELTGWKTRAQNAWVRANASLLDRPGGFPFVTSWVPARKLKP